MSEREQHIALNCNVFKGDYVRLSSRRRGAGFVSSCLSLRVKRPENNTVIQSPYASSVRSISYWQIFQWITII